MKKTYLFLVLFLGVGLFAVTSCCSSKKSVSNSQTNMTIPDTASESSEGTPARVPAYPDPVEYELPDGYLLTIQLKGDEWKHNVYTVDGFHLVMNPEGYYEYTIRDDQGLPQPTGIIARNPEDRTEDQWRVLRSIKQ